MVLMIRFFIVILISIFIVNVQHCNIFSNGVLCMKSSINFLFKNILNGKPLYYFGDVKLIELSYRIQFLLDNFDKIDLKTVKYDQKHSIFSKFEFNNPFHHPHFLVELKNNIDNFNNFYLNFQLSTKQRLEFEELSNIDLNMYHRNQYISPYLRVYSTNMVEILENEYETSSEFIELNKNNINNYVYKNLKEYIFNFEIIKK